MFVLCQQRWAKTIHRFDVRSWCIYMYVRISWYTHAIFFSLFIISCIGRRKQALRCFFSFFFVREHHGVNPHTEFRTHNRINTHFIYNLHSIPPSTKIPKLLMDPSQCVGWEIFHPENVSPLLLLLMWMLLLCWLSKLKGDSTWLLENFRLNSKQLLSL